MVIPIPWFAHIYPFSAAFLYLVMKLLEVGFPTWLKKWFKFFFGREAFAAVIRASPNLSITDSKSVDHELFPLQTCLVLRSNFFITYFLPR